MINEELIDEIKENEEIIDELEELENDELDSTDDSSFYSDDNNSEYDDFDDLLNSQSSMTYQNISVNDPVKMFLKEIGNIKLLDVEKEQELAKIIYDSKMILDEYKEKVNNGYNPSKEEEDHIKAVTHEFEQAKNRLCEANLRLVVNIAKHFNNSNMDFSDLIQEGTLGLAKAAVKFDYTRGNKFSTYATNWIKQSITRAIADQSRTIRIPVHMNETINKLNKKENELTHELGRKPTNEELAKEMNLSLHKLMFIKLSSMKPKSLEDKVGDDEDSTVGDFIRDNEILTPEEYAVKQSEMELLDKLLSNLSEKEERVLRLRFGLIDGRSRTLEEVGEEFNLTRERIRQVESKALNKLKKQYESNIKEEGLDK